ncbi:hypothetical protein [Aquifex sp.]
MFTLTLLGFLFAQPWYLKDCINKVVDGEVAIREAKPYTGKVYKLYLTKRRQTGECLYKVKGVKGTAVIDGISGKLIKFFKKE